MEEVIAIAIGVLAASGTWLVLRPRTFQVVMGLCLLSYGVNLFIFSMGSLFIGKEPVIKNGVPQDLLNYTDPLPQALVLTAIVISFCCDSSLSDSFLILGFFQTTTGCCFPPNPKRLEFGATSWT